jgi:hypothetical protein
MCKALIIEVRLLHRVWNCATWGYCSFRNYKSNKQKAIEQYKQALALGYTQSIGKVFETAGVKFDFSENYIKELATFIQKELNSI